MIRIGHDATHQEAETERSRAQTPACVTQGNPVKNKTKQINKSYFFLEIELGALPLSSFPPELFKTGSLLCQPFGDFRTLCTLTIPQSMLLNITPVS